MIQIASRAGTTLHLPLPLYAMVPLGDASDGDKRFTVVAGLDERLVGQLKRYSLDLADAELQKTSDHMRFGEGSYAEWYASKERTLFALVDAGTGMLAAIAWFGPKPLGRKSMKHLSDEDRRRNEKLMDSEGWHTIVYRSYPPFRGTGLMTSFLQYVMGVYRACYPGVKLWAGIYADNPASVGFATRLGFRVLDEASKPEANEVVMVQG